MDTKKVASRTFSAPFSGDTATALKAWWASLEDNKGLRASLRRMTSPRTVFFERELYTLLGTLRASNSTISDEGLAVVMGLLAHVKTSLDGKTFGGFLGSGDGEKARLSEARFKRLLVVESREEMYRDMIRVLRLAGGVAPITDFANLVYWWNERSKREFAKEYYKALTRAHDEESSISETTSTANNN